MTAPRMCGSAVVSKANGTLLLDGHEFPFWVTDDVEVEGLSRDELTVLRLGVIVEGVVLLYGYDGERRVIDSELGDVGAWARSYVRESFTEAFPWLVTS